MERFRARPPAVGHRCSDDAGQQHHIETLVGVSSLSLVSVFSARVLTNVLACAMLWRLRKAAENEASKFKAPSHAIRFRYYMGPEGLDSQTCLDNGQCLPVGGQSVWGHIGELEAVDDGGKPVVMLVAAMDSNALFHEAAVGAASAASDIVTVIAAVDALKRAGVESLPLTVAFGLFQGESFGRVGSRRWLDEVEDFACPAANVQPASKSSTGKDFCRGPLRTDLSFTKLSMASFAHVVGVDQSGSPGEEFYVHQPSGTGDSTLLDVVQMTALHSRQPATWPVGDHGLPPTAVDTFLQHNLSLSTAVLSKYASSYSDRYYHSHLDDQHNVNTVRTSCGLYNPEIHLTVH